MNIKKYLLPILIVFITLYFVHSLVDQQLVWGDFSYTGKESNEIVQSNFLYTWSHANMGTTPRMSFGTILPLIATSIPLVDNDVVYLLLRILPIFLITLVTFKISLLLTKNAAASFLTTILSIANPAVIGDIMNGQTLWIYPIVLSLFWISIKIFFLHEINLSNVILLAVFLFFALALLPPIVVPLVIALVVFNSFSLLQIKSHKTFILSVSAVLGSFLIFFLLSFPYFFVASSGQQAHAAPSTLQDYYHNYSKTSLINTFRLSGNAGSGQETLGYNESSYSNIFGYSIFLLLVVIFLYSINNRELRQKTQYILAAFATLLMFLGFIHLITVNKEIGTGIFEGQWLAGTIRNPTKLFVIMLQLFLLIFAYSTSLILERMTGHQTRIYLFFTLVTICILVYGWPSLRGDLGLFYEIPKNARLQNLAVLKMVEIANSRSGRSVIIPSDHDDELRYESLSTNLNALRLGGDYLRTQDVKSGMNSSFNSQLKDFEKYMNLSGFSTIFLKKEHLFKPTPFSLFPAKIDYDAAKSFLDTTYENIIETNDFIVYENEGAFPVIYSPVKVMAVDEIDDFDNIIALHNQPKEAVVLLQGIKSVSFFEKYVSSKGSDSQEVNKTIAVLRNPDVVSIGIQRKVADDKKEIYISELHPFSKRSLKNRRILTIPDTHSVQLLKIGNKTVRLSDDEHVFLVRSGLHVVESLSLLRVNFDASLTNLSFEKTDPLYAGDASIGRSGSSEISAKTTDDASEEKKSLLLTSKNHIAYYKISLPIEDPLSKYYLSFDYKNIEGLAPSFSLYQNGTTTPLVYGQLLKKKAWTSTGVSFTVDSKTRSIDLYYYTDSQNNTLSQNLLDNIALFKEQKIGSYNMYVSSYPRSVVVNDKEQLKIIRPTEGNLVQNHSFEISNFDNWYFGDASAGKGGDPAISYSFSEQNTDGQRSIQLNSKNHLAYISQKVIEADLDSSYKISFDYKNLLGQKPSFGIWQTGVNRTSLSKVLSNSTKGWERYESVFTPDVGATAVYIYFYSGSNNNEETSNLFDNIKLEKIPMIKNYLTLKNNISYSQPNLIVKSFDEINPTFYRIKVEGNKGLLVLNESFHDGWKASLRIGLDTKIIDNDYHIVVNGFANGWLIDEAEFKNEYEIILEFIPQRWFYIGLLISGITLVSCLGYLGWGVVRARRKARGGTGSKLPTV